MTARMVAAIEHPLVDVIGHPTGRKIETRAPYALDVERVIEAAARTHTMLEINAAPDRRDLNEIHARAAAEAGVLIVVDSDAHSVRNLGLITLRDRHGAARVAVAGAGGEHALVGGAGAAAQAEPRGRMSAQLPRRRQGRPSLRARRGPAGDLVRRARARRRDAGLGRRADVGDRVRRLGADRGAVDPRRGRRARRRARARRR